MIPAFVYGTHNRAGEITYEHVSGYTYEITLTTYTYTPSAANEDRDELTISWGDDTYSEVSRISITYLPDDYQKNIYIGKHSFPGPGTYYVLMEDKNRNAGIDNIVESVFIPFAIKTKLVINSIIGENSAPLLLNPPIDKAVVGQRFVHNPTAFDLDGDSLSYILTVCSGSMGNPIEDYSYPIASDSLYVDPLTGDLVWNAPVSEGRYNIAMVVLEYRDGIQISAIVRDIQIDVEEADNTPPVIVELSDQCVIAGDSVSFPVQAYDVDEDIVELIAVGGVFEVSGRSGEFNSVTASTEVSSLFRWDTECSQVRQQPYSILFKATDNGNVPLSDQEYVSIKIRGKPSEIDSVYISHDKIEISIDESDCDNAIGVRLFKSVGSFPLDDSLCIATMPQEFILLTDTVSTVTSFHDLDIEPGFKYCYRLETVYKDGALSYPSESVCVEKRDNSPVFSQTSVLDDSDDLTIVSLQWTQYVIDTATIVHNAFYVLERYVANDQADKWQTVFTSSSVNSISFIDSIHNPIAYNERYRLLTVLTDVNLNAIDTLHATTATIVPVLSLEENAVRIKAKGNTPWINNLYTVYKYNDSLDVWDSLLTVEEPTIVDTVVEYGIGARYKIVSTGAYGLSDYPSGIVNWSHEASIRVDDTFAPVVKLESVDRECQTGFTKISLSTDVRDVDYYLLYLKSCVSDSNIIIIDTVDRVDFTMKVDNRTGCYAVKAVDFAGNESNLSDWFCTEACPSYILPTVFTPNGNQENETFRPLENKFVHSVEVQIYNIWGDLVFSTDDVNINWSGVNNEGEMLPDGMYYYICEVFEEWSSCDLESRTLIGFVYKFSDGNTDVE